MESWSKVSSEAHLCSDPHPQSVRWRKRAGRTCDSDPSQAHSVFKMPSDCRIRRLTPHHCSQPDPSPSLLGPLQLPACKIQHHKSFLPLSQIHTPILSPLRPSPVLADFRCRLFVSDSVLDSLPIPSGLPILDNSCGSWTILQAGCAQTLSGSCHPIDLEAISQMP